MKLKLYSNFSDYPLDMFFDMSGVLYNRRNDIGYNRIEMFQFFTKNHILTPFYGYFDDFCKINYAKDKKVVIYDNIRSHFGENKRICVFSELKDVDKSFFMSEYIKTDISPLSSFTSKSTRYLFIGDTTLMYDYYSENDWRSNVGDGIITLPTLLDTPSWRYNINRAMFAIDLVGNINELRAIDLNLSPGIQGVNVQRILSYDHIINLIKHWIQKYGVDEWSQNVTSI